MKGKALDGFAAQLFIDLRTRDLDCSLSRLFHERQKSGFGGQLFHDLSTPALDCSLSQLFHEWQKP
jgi:hypothetical protein